LWQKEVNLFLVNNGTPHINMNTIEASEIEPCVQLILNAFRKKKVEQQQANNEAREELLNKRRKAIADVNEGLETITSHLRVLFQYSNTLNKLMCTYQTSCTDPFIELQKIAASEGVFVASVGLVKTDNNGWTVAVYEKSVCQQHLSWHPAGDEVYDRLTVNYQLILSRLGGYNNLIEAIVERLYVD
jgi:hypothetical protein